MILNLFKLFKKNNKSPSSTTAIRPATRTNIETEWRNIDILIKGKSPSQLRQALISADKTLDNALRDRVSGESMGERLKMSKDLFDWNFYQKIWDAHKMRNSLVHESGYEPPYHMLLDGVETLRQAVNNLGIRV